jgi:hypothetical protein
MEAYEEICNALIEYFTIDPSLHSPLAEYFGQFMKPHNIDAGERDRILKLMKISPEGYGRA